MYPHSAGVNISTLNGQLELHQKRNTYKFTYMFIWYTCAICISIHKPDQARLIPSRSRRRRPQIKNATQIVFGTCVAPPAEVNTIPRTHTHTHSHTHSKVLINKAGDADSLGLPCAAIELVDLAEICKKGLAKESLASGGRVAGWLPLISLSPRDMQHTPAPWRGRVCIFN